MNKFQIAFLSMSTVVALMIMVAPLQSASITVERSVNCLVRLKGSIAPGDTEALRQIPVAFKALLRKGEGREGGEHSICLDSPGGSWREALKMAKFIMKQSIGTRVMGGAGCYSACALIFMAGRNTGLEVDGSYRYLHVRGKLGFHAPYLSIPDSLSSSSSGFSSRDVEEAFASASKMISDLMVLFSEKTPFSGEPLIKPSLISQMSKTPRDKFVLIDTVGKALRWNISIYGHNLKISPSKTANINACHNFDAIKQGRPFEKPDFDQYSGWRGRTGYQKHGNHYRVDLGSGMAEHYCDVNFDQKGQYFQICTVNGFKGIRLGDCPTYGHIERNLIGIAADYPLRRLPSK